MLGHPDRQQGDFSRIIFVVVVRYRFWINDEKSMDIVADTRAKDLISFK